MSTLIKIYLPALLLALTFIACKNKQETPAAIVQTSNKDELFKQYHLDKIKLPPGFSISVFAQVPGARSMCFGDKGTLFVGNHDAQNVYAVIDSNNDGRAEKVIPIGKGLSNPNGVAFRNGSLYVAEISRILRYDNIENNLNNPPEPKIITDKLPTRAHHGWKYIAFGPDGKLYVPVGAPCNVCNEDDSIFATITRMNPDGSHLELFAKGVRNSVGFDWHPVTKQLWFTDNGRDNLGDDKPFCELNLAPEKGLHFGFPFCHEGDILDPEFGAGKSCADYVAPAKKLGPHLAPLGMHFYTGTNFPAAYTNQIFIAEHGSWNRSKLIGYKVSVATLEGNTVKDYQPFAQGWLNEDGSVMGRPVDVKVAPDGALLISDDYAGAIYRVVYSK